MARRIVYPQRPLGFRLLNVLVRSLPIRRKLFFNAALLSKHIDCSQAGVLPTGCEFRMAADDDLTLIARHPEALSEDVYQRRLKRGDRCYLLCHDERRLSWRRRAPP